MERGLLWADEDLDGTAVYQNPDIVDDGSDDDGDVSNDDDADRLETTNLKAVAENKSLKRKEKFEKLKKVKKLRHDETESESKDACALSAASMADLIRSSEPIASINASTDDLKFSLTESNFFDPSKSLHAQAKSSCIFVNSIAASIPAFRKALGAETKSSDENGSPIVLVVCASAHRSTDIINSMSNGEGKPNVYFLEVSVSISANLCRHKFVSVGLKCKIAKLFAKHFKVQDQVDLLSKQYFPVAVGTPNRLSKLVELGALSLSRVKVRAYN